MATVPTPLLPFTETLHGLTQAMEYLMATGSGTLVKIERDEGRNTMKKTDSSQIKFLEELRS